MKNSKVLFSCVILLSSISAFGEGCYTNLPDNQNNQCLLKGIVIAKETGRPITGAEVFTRNCQGIQQKAAADVNGMFELAKFPNGEQGLYVVAKGFASRRIIIKIGKEQTISEQKIELMPSSKVAGIVKNQQGKPVENAKVKTFHFTNNEVMTDANGFYEIDGLDPMGGERNLEVFSDSYPSAFVNFSPLPAGQTARLDIVLKQGSAVHGQVFDPNGRPLPGATVGNTQSRCMWNHVESITDANGFYKLKNIDTGELVLWTVHPLYPPYVERFTIGNKETEKQINIKFEPAKPLHCKVVDKQGKPVEGVMACIGEVKGVTNLSNCNDRVKSDAQGKFTIGNAPASGKIILEVFSDKTPNIRPELEIGKDEHIIEVETAGKIYGRVVDDQTGKPVEKFNVKMTFSKTGSKPGWGYNATWSREGYNFSDPNGFFDTGRENIPVGACYMMTVLADGLDPLTIDPTIVQAITNEPNRTEFRLKPATIVSGKVVNENNEPVSGASVRWFSESNRLDMYDDHWDNTDTTITDANGNFTFKTIGTGLRGLYISAFGFAPYVNSTLVFPDDTNKIAKINLEKGCEVYGTVFKGGVPGTVFKGTPDAGVEISCDFHRRYDLQRMGYIQKKATTDANGNYVLSDLPSGETRLYTRSPIINNTSHTQISKKITLSPGQRVKLDFGNEEGFTVTGWIKQGKTPLTRAQITFRDNSENSTSATSDSNGFYMASGLAKGKYQVSAFYQNRQPCSGSSCGKFNPNDTLQENQIILDVNSDTTLNIDFGSAAISGKIPNEFIGKEKLYFMVRRWNPQERLKDTKWTYKTNWEYVNPRSTPDSNGLFELKNLKSGKYYITLHGDNNFLALSEIFEISETGKTDVNFVPATAKLRAIIIEAETKEPLPDVICNLKTELEIYFTDNKKPDPNVIKRNITDTNGVIEYERLPKGIYTFSVQKDGFLYAKKDNIIIDANNQASIEIALEKSAVVKFVASESVEKLTTLPCVYLWCRATNLATGKPYSIDTNQWQNVYLKMPEKVTKLFKPVLNLPEGKYLIEYELYQDAQGSRTYAIQQPVAAGKTEIDLKAGETTEIIIK